MKERICLFSWTSRHMLCLLLKSAKCRAKGILPKWCCESKPNTGPARATWCWFCLMGASAYDSQKDAPEVCPCDLRTHELVLLWHHVFSKLSWVSSISCAKCRMEVGLPWKALWIVFEYFSLWSRCWVSSMLETDKGTRLVRSGQPRWYNA